MAKLKNAQKGLLMVLISGTVFGALPGVVKYCASQGVTSVTMIVFRFAAVALFLLPAAIKQKTTFVLYRKYFLKLFIISAFGAATPIFLFWSYDFLPTGVSTTVHFLYPTVVMLLCILFFRERPNAVKLFCVALCVIGVLLMLDLSGASVSVRGMIIAFTSGVMWAAHIVLLDKYRIPGATTEQMTFIISVNNIILTAAYGFIKGEMRLDMTPTGLLSLIVSSLIIGILGEMFFLFGVRKADAQTAAIAGTLEPIVSIAVGILFLHETVTLRTGIGSVLILSAVVLIAIYGGRGSEKAQK